MMDAARGIRELSRKLYDNLTQDERALALEKLHSIVSAEKPLHVLVAEKLGWTGAKIYPARPGTIYDTPHWRARPAPNASRAEVPRYDTDWSATGPLIERFGIELCAPGEHGGSEVNWLASKRIGWIPVGNSPHAYADTTDAEGSTPLIAVCNLILALPDEVVR